MSTPAPVPVPVPAPDSVPVPQARRQHQASTKRWKYAPPVGLPTSSSITTPAQPQELLYSAMMLAARDRLSAASHPPPWCISDAPVVAAASTSNVVVRVCSRLNPLMPVSYDHPECVRGKVIHLLHGV